MKKISREELRKELGVELSDDMLEKVTGGGLDVMTIAKGICKNECSDRYISGEITSEEWRICSDKCEQPFG